MSGQGNSVLATQLRAYSLTVFILTLFLQNGNQHRLLYKEMNLFYGFMAEIVYNGGNITEWSHHYANRKTSTGRN